MGVGIGGFPHEFAAAGYPSGIAERAELMRSNMEICRRLWAGERVTFKNRYFDFADVALKPTLMNSIPVWAGGGTPAACRRAVAYCDGWMPARITLATFEKLIPYIRGLCENAGKPMITAAVMPLTSVGITREEALKRIDIAALIAEANKFTSWSKRAGVEFASFEDIRGFLLAGAPSDIAREARAYAEAGANHVVFDLRFRFGDWLAQIDLLGREVLPAFKESGDRPVAPTGRGQK
jgi:alkanesulfonate monooxygenase SsuD/methylene tetrahydromethanopterin reductase-like flavin-dependent oxidoreductase (luciferase family)